MSKLFKALKKAEQEAPLHLKQAIPDGVDPHLVSLLTPTAFETESYRLLGHMVEQMHKEAGLRILGVSSPTAGDGKTTTAINLAGILARDPDNRVLLLEADLRRPSMGAYLGLGHTSSNGLVDTILDPALSLENAVRQCHPFNLSILPAGRPLASPHGVLRSLRLEELLEAARQCYDYLIVDTPPLVPLTDCRLIEQWIDGFLVVVAAHKTPRKLLEEALNVVDPAKLIGLIFNEDDSLSSKYYAYHYSVQSPNGHHKGQRSFRQR